MVVKTKKTTTKKAAPKKRVYGKKKPQDEPKAVSVPKPQKDQQSLVKTALMRNEDYLNAFKHETPIVSNTSLAHFTNLNVAYKVYPALSNTYETIICVLPFNNEFTTFSWRGSDGQYIGGGSASILNANPPNTARLSRCSIRMLNQTKNDQIEGVVNTYRANTGLTFGFSGATLDLTLAGFGALRDLCLNSNNASSITMKELSDGEHGWNTLPISMQQYETYKDFNIYTGSLSQLQDEIIETTKSNSMSPILFHIPAATSASTIQSIQMHVKLQYCAKYLDNSLIAHVSKTYSPPDRSNLLMSAYRAEVAKESKPTPTKEES